MTLTRRFDYDEYVKQFRTACAQRGIDPLDGATGYQVVHFKAEQRRAAWLRESADRWWLQHDLWTDCPPYHSDTEQVVFWELFRSTYLIALRRIRDERRRQRGLMALRDLHRYQRLNQHGSSN